MMEQRKFAGNRLLRFGYTTGSCAAGAAKAAVILLLTGQAVPRVHIDTPKGVPLDLEILDPVRSGDTASCAVRKDGGDDPDATNGLLVYATVRRIEAGIRIDGGKGVGRVTKPGLDQPVGSAAINHVPRQMIEEAVRDAMAGMPGGMEVLISVPEGEAVGRKTFNPHLGIEGGISILGTSGIVEPMSEKALIETTRVELNMLRVSGTTDLLLTVGSYGDDFVQAQLGFPMDRRVKCSNFIGETLSDAVALGFRRVLLVGHIGKLVKLGAGIMNTHSAQGDARMEILVSCALAAGASLETLRAVAGCITTDAALEILQQAALLGPSMRELERRIQAHLERRFGDYLELGTIVFCGQKEQAEILCLCGRAGPWLEKWRENHDN